MGNAAELTNNQLAAKNNLDARLAPRSKWDRVTALLLVAWLVAAVVNVGGYWWWEAPLRTWIALGASAPILLAVGFSLVVIAANTGSQHLVRRDSILWRWFAGIGRGLSASIGLAVGALLGGLVGSGIAAATTLDDLRNPLQLVLLVVMVGFAVAVVWWTTIAAIDMGRISRAERAEAVRRAFPRTRDRRRGFPQFLASLSDPFAIIVWGLIALFLIAQGYVWGLSALGTP